MTLHTGAFPKPTADGQSTSTHVSQKAGPSTWSDVSIHHHTQSSHSYHTFPPQDVHYQGQQATPPPVQQVVPNVSHSYGLQLTTPSAASDSLYHGGELEYPHIIMSYNNHTVHIQMCTHLYPINLWPSCVVLVYQLRNVVIYQQKAAPKPLLG